MSTLRFCALFSLIVWTYGLVAMPEQVILLRHGEKPSIGDTLSPLGFKRSDALVTYFSSGNRPFEIATPAAIYAQRSNKNHSSTRPVQTVGPLANYWQVPLYTFYSSEKITKMVKSIDKRFTSGLVVICWSHDNLQEIARTFGVKNVPNWPSNIFDWVWVITFSEDQVASFERYVQPPITS